MDCRIGYVIVGVKALEPAVAFYRDVMGFEFLFSEPEFHFASFKVGDMRSRSPKAPRKPTAPATATPGSASWSADVDAAHAELAAKGVQFTMGPGKMPWGGYMAMFVDPDGNEFYLDQAQ